MKDLYIDKILNQQLATTRVLNKVEYKKAEIMSRTITDDTLKTVANLKEVLISILELIKYNLINARIDLFYLSASNFYHEYGNYYFFQTQNYSLAHKLLYKSLIYASNYNRVNTKKQHTKLLPYILYKYFYCGFFLERYQNISYNLDSLKRKYDFLREDNLLKCFPVRILNIQFVYALIDVTRIEKESELFLLAVEFYGINKIDLKNKGRYYCLKARHYLEKNDYKNAIECRDKVRDTHKEMLSTFSDTSYLISNFRYWEEHFDISALQRLISEVNPDTFTEDQAKVIKKFSQDTFSNSSWCKDFDASTPSETHILYYTFLLLGYLNDNFDIKRSRKRDRDELLSLLELEQKYPDIRNYKRIRKLFSHLISYRAFTIDVFRSPKTIVSILRESIHLIKNDILALPVNPSDDFVTKQLIKMDLKAYSEYKILAQIEKGENISQEFKSSFRVSNKGLAPRDVELISLTAICAFLNTSGGVLYVGVSDSAELIGVESDIDSLGKKNNDGFELHIQNLIHQYFGAVCNKLISIDFPIIKGIKICRVKVMPSEKPVFLKEDFYIRQGSSSRSLKREELVDYINLNWKSVGIVN